MRAFCWFCLWTGCLLAQGTPVKKSAADYAGRATLDRAEIGSEMMGHSVTWQQDSLIAGDFLVVEVAVFPKGTDPLTIRHAQFSLRLNGKGGNLQPQSVGAVAAWIKYPDWVQRARLESSASMGDAGIVLGRPPAVGRFPGDPQIPTRLPQPQSPTPGSTAGASSAEPPKPPEEILGAAALPEVDTRYPVSGYLYFPFKGKLKKLKKVELLYDGPAGSVVIPVP